ncbi:MAG TPA: cytochrome c [Gammaproteobacteria bacterium]|nr:cytochrome c [Gammaproteobacteria bacterium]
MRYVYGFVIGIVLIIGGFLAYIYSGGFDVAATRDNPGWIDWIISTTREHSIEARVASVKVPADINLSDPAMVAEGAKHYKAMCEVCHLAPGQSDSETRAGLNPRPPNLPKIAQYIEPNEAFWIIKNGIRMTAMPAWGPTHSDQKIWAIVAFVKALPQIDAARYRMLTAGAEEMEMHEHGNAPAPTSMAMPASLQKPATLSPPPE